MSYTPQTWVDGSGGGTPITAASLNHMETGIDDADTRLTAVEGAYAPAASPTFTGTVTVPTPATGSAATTKTYVDSFATSRAVALAMVLGS